MSDSKGGKTFNVRKDKRFKAKKRKLEAFLNLVRKDEETPIRKKKSSGSFADHYKTLKDELKKYQTKDSIEPSFHLTDVGQNALVTFSSNDKSVKCSSPLFVEDIYYLLLKSVLSSLSPFSLRWAKLELPHQIGKTVVIEMEGLSINDIFEINTELNQKCNIFPYVFEIVSSKIPFATELSTLHMVTGFYSETKENYSSLFPMKEDGNSKTEKSTKQNTITKLHLLLSPIQLAMENYPLPQSIFKQSNCKNYVFTKEAYAPVTANSEMFALDCEMCRTANGNEVTRIAIVNEDLETVYHSFVKPASAIIDYLTRFSGITAKLMKNVTTTLADVHREMSKILPSDAILCGQSLNCDLHALKLIHPYAIDTSVIFNQHGIRRRKTSLRNLTKIYLKEIIQDKKGGHNPIEDSIATMKLVQLKLENSIHYGDAVLSPEETENSSDTAEIAADKSVGNNSTVQKTRNFSDYVKLNEGPEYCGFFDRITKFSKKKVCLVGNEDSLNNYCLEAPIDKITKVTKSSIKKIIESTISNLADSNLNISHLTFNAENDSLTDVIDELKQAYASLPGRTLFLLITGLNKSNDENFNHRYCMASLKKSVNTSLS